jgi:hypothetical protein
MVELLIGIFIGIVLTKMATGFGTAIHARRLRPPATSRPDPLKVLIRFIGAYNVVVLILLLNGIFFLPLIIPFPGVFRLIVAVCSFIATLIFCVDRSRKLDVPMWKVLLYVGRV